MTERSDIMRGSNAWRRLTDGIPRKVGAGDQVGGDELRTYLHDVAQSLLVIVAQLDHAIDTASIANKSVSTLDDRVFDSESGIISKLRQEHRDENKWVLRAVVGGLVSIIVTLIVMVVTARGSA